ncbi:MAG: hypothetical protein NTV93_08385 [Verrucomicrobia bacterium]|nr:hypothetical protein [Verrucomicrobiota bacterium]
MDFIGTKRGDLPEELRTNPEGDPPILKINGVRVDTPNEGVFLTKELAAKTAVEVENQKTGAFYKVASPTLLYREKLELGKMEGAGERPQDILHLQTLQRAAKLVLCKLAEDPNLNQKQAALLFKLLKETQEIAPELLEDQRLLMRLQARAPGFLGNPKTKAIYHLLTNQILPK